MRLTLLFTLFMVLSAGCAPALPVERPPEPVESASPTLSAPSIETAPFYSSVTYRDEVNGFELDYLSDWSVDPDSVLGTRASQARLLSPGSTAETLAPGGSRLSITVYQWDPRGDLGAYVAQRRIAWDASGFIIRDGSLTQLKDGRPASDFFIQPLDGALTYFLFTTLDDQYLELAGEGDLALLEAIGRTLRPLSDS